jgi:hypothetical protein
VAGFNPLGDTQNARDTCDCKGKRKVIRDLSNAVNLHGAVS